MAEKITKLELTWIGKEIRPRLEPRILLEDAEKSYHAAQRVSTKDICFCQRNLAPLCR
jgi:adenine-specific DNA-methyltransferase